VAAGEVVGQMAVEKGLLVAVAEVVVYGAAAEAAEEVKAAAATGKVTSILGSICMS
jgi:hypothetical protein